MEYVTDTLSVVESFPELERAGSYVLSRMEDLGLSREAAVRRSELNRETWKRVERGQRVKADTYRAVERALNWPAGTMQRIIGGGEPPDPSDMPVHVTVTSRADMRVLMAALLDTDDAGQQLMIDTALAALEAYKRSQR